jgi:hypothetical protein
MAVYDWERQLALGQGVEKRLDQALSRHYVLRPVDEALQKLGIDRIAVNKKTRVAHSIEYKADFLMAATGRVFIETLANSAEDRPGWVKSMMAQILVYADAATGIAYFVNAVDIKRLDLKKYPRAEVRNGRYFTVGHTIPLSQLEKMAFGRIKFDTEGVMQDGPATNAGAEVDA